MSAARPDPPRVYLVGTGEGDGGRQELRRHDPGGGPPGGHEPGPGATDVLGRERPARRWPAVAAGVLLLGGLAGVRADAALAERERDALLDRVEAGLSTVGYTDRRLQGTVRYFSPALVSASVDQGVRDSLQRIVREEAAGQVGAVRAQREEAAAVRVLPWHEAEREAQDRWVAYLDARIAFLEAVAGEFRRLYQPRPEQEAALAQAREAFARAGAAETRTAVVFDR